VVAGKEIKFFHGRLKKGIERLAREYLSCLEEDERIFEIDLSVVKTHSLMLNKQGYLSKNELEKILSALEKLKRDWREGKLKKLFSKANREFTDIHPFIEQYLIDTCGIEIGGKVNLGRSRNDQVVTDLRIYLREEILEIGQSLIDFIQSLLILVTRHYETVFPGYTHRQPAQVTTYAHYLLSYVDIFLRDLDRLKEVYSRINLNPLGASALAGSSLPLDREYTRKLLNFGGILENSIDAVSSRDFLLESANASVLIMLSLSRMAKDLILWSSYEFGLLELADGLSDISTAMPQKKNPSILELLLGKTHLAVGLLNHLYTTLGGLESGYNQELQELKSSLWKIIDFTRPSIKITQEVFLTLKINKERIREILEKSYLTAIDFAEFLVKSGYVRNFRKAHFLVGNTVKELIKEKRFLSQLTPEEMRKISRKVLGKEICLTQDVIKKVTDPILGVRQRKSLGGPAPEEVKRMWKFRQKELNIKKKDWKVRISKLKDS